MLSLDKAIKHCEEKAEELREQASFDTDNERYRMSESEKTECIKCAEEYEQLTEWLKDYKRLLEEKLQGEWIMQRHDLDGCFYTCSNCGRMIRVSLFIDDPEDNETLADYPFCHCGARMNVDTRGDIKC